MSKALTKEEIIALPDRTRVRVEFQATCSYATKTNFIMKSVVDSEYCEYRNGRQKYHSNKFFLARKEDISAQGHCHVKYIYFGDLANNVHIYLVDSPKEDFQSLCSRIKDKYRKKNV